MRKRHQKTLIAMVLVVFLLEFAACSTNISRKDLSTISKAREIYSFDLDNNRFVGEQNDQEMGDYQICFNGEIKTFSGLTIGKGADYDVWKEWLVITEDSVEVYDAENQEIIETIPHGLSFKDYISVNIMADLYGKAIIEILTNGGAFKREDVNWIGRNGRLIAEATGDNTVLKNCTLSYSCNGWNKEIWLYGDSYFSMTESDRWTTYLVQDGADNIMLSGHSGEGSKETLTAFLTQLQYGSPKTVVWCVGMNDGDSKDSINPDYKACLDEVTAICEEKDIELILATIPTCPYWFNDHKNKYIKSNNYTYIDFADAVGSYDSITWNEDMLEDGVNRIHPTTNGALAMYGKAISVIPDLLNK